MAVHERLAGQLAQDVVGTQTWNTTGCHTMPTEDWDLVYWAMTQLLLLIGDRCDWQRLLLEAHQRCLTLDHQCLPEDHDERHAYGIPCGESLHAAFVSGKSYTDWEVEPGPRTAPDIATPGHAHPWAEVVHRLYPHGKMVGK